MKTKEETTLSKVFQFEAGIKQGKQEAVEEVLEIIEEEIINEKKANVGKAVRYWTYENELRLLKSKIKGEK